MICNFGMIGCGSRNTGCDSSVPQLLFPFTFQILPISLFIMMSHIKCHCNYSFNQGGQSDINARGTNQKENALKFRNERLLSCHPIT